MSKLPKLKKKVTAFLVGEEGKVSKESVLKAGVILSSLALSSAILSKDATAVQSHTNDIYTEEVGDGMKGWHSHHASHASGTGTGTGTGTYY